MRKLLIRILFGKKLSVIEELHAAERQNIHAFYSAQEVGLRREFENKLSELTNEAGQVHELLVDALMLARAGTNPDLELEKWIRQAAIAALDHRYNLYQEHNLATSEREKAIQVFDSASNIATERLRFLQETLLQQ